MKPFARSRCFTTSGPLWCWHKAPHSVTLHVTYEGREIKGFLSKYLRTLVGAVGLEPTTR